MKLGFLVGYGFQGPEPFQAPWLERPSIPFNRFEKETWDEIFRGVLRSRVDIVLPVLRGSQDVGFKALQLLEEAARPFKRPYFAPFVDTGALGDILTGEPFDFLNVDHLRAVWQITVQPCMEMFKSKLYKLDGRPLIVWYSLNDGIVPQGLRNKEKCQDLLEFISASSGIGEYGKPLHIVDTSWPTIDVFAKHSWFSVENGYSATLHNSNMVGVTVPGFHDHPGANVMRVLPRRKGETLRENLQKLQDAGCDLVLLEGLTDIEESAGFYPSTHPEWPTPNHYLDIVASFAEYKEEPQPQPVEDVKMEVISGQALRGFPESWLQPGDSPDKESIRLPNGKYLSVQHDGTYQTRDSVGAWESGTRSPDGKELVYVIVYKYQDAEYVAVWHVPLSVGL